jgi:hypothetical protein
MGNEIDQQSDISAWLRRMFRELDTAAACVVELVYWFGVNVTELVEGYGD